MSILDWFRKHHPQPPAPPPPAQGARLVSMDVSPTNTTCVLTPQGDYPIAPITATEMVPEAPWHKTFQVGADVPPWGGDVVCSAPGYIDQHFFWLIPSTDTQWPSVTLQPAFTPAPREYAGNMCGIYIDGLPPVPGGASNPALLLSWFYDRYPDEWRAQIRAAWQQRGLTDVLLSWPDSRGVGKSPQDFAATCQELIANGFRPCVMLCSKDYDPQDVGAIQASIGAVLPLLQRVVPRFGVGWELSLWLSPTQVQQLIDWLAPQITPWGGKLYVHFQQGYASFQQDGGTFADFWNRQVGKLTGLLHQRDLSWDQTEYPARLVDILDRFAGQYNCVPDSGFGHPFDCIALEITAMNAFNEGMSEADQNAWARCAMSAQPVSGPLGPVKVMGAGNGCA